jgi:hypothetical protein
MGLSLTFNSLLFYLQFDCRYKVMQIGINSQDLQVFLLANIDFNEENE